MLGYKSFIEESANITAMDSSECWINSILILFNACYVWRANVRGLEFARHRFSSLI